MTHKKQKNRRVQSQSPFVDIIIEIRKNKKMSQETLAHEIGMERSAYGHIETGYTQLTTDTLVKVCKALKIKVNLVLEEVKTEEKILN